MWNRAELKGRAKNVLRSIYWKAFGISIVIALVSGGGSSSGSSRSRSGNNNSASIFSNESFAAPLLFGTIVLLMLLIAFRIIIGYQLEVGGRKYFVQSAQYIDNRGCFRYAFNGHNYTGILLTMLLKGVQNFLWFLLLIIPGIIKLYAYRMVPYILADNPNIGCKRAIELSCNMTKGHKFDIFILDLSFIGWYLLGLLALVVGTLFVLPYQNATEAELYLVLRQNALAGRMCSPEELLLSYRS